MSKYHPYKRGTDWGLIFAIGSLTLLVLGLVALAIGLATREDPEPTSRCLDSKYRIFERHDEFSVVEDTRCNEVK